MAFHGMGGTGMATYWEEQKKRGRKTDARTVRRVIEAFKPYRFTVILVVIAILLTTVLGLVNPLMIQRIFDDAIGKRDFTKLVIYVGIMIVTPVITGMIGVWQTYLNNMIGQNVMRDFRNRLYQHLQSMSLRFFTGTRTGEIQSRLSNDVNGVQGVVTNTATSIVANISTVISTIIAMLFLSPLLTLVSLGLLPVFLWITTKVGNVRRSASKETQQSMASLTAMMQETLSVSGILLMKTFSRQKYAQQLFEKENQQLTNLEIRQQMIGRWFFMFINVFFSITPAIVYLIAGWQIISRSNPFMTLGVVVAFTTLQSRLFFPVGQLLTIQVEVQGALALFDRIFEYLDMPIDITDAPNARTLSVTEMKGRVTFKDVSFAYKRDEPAIVSLGAGKDGASTNGKPSFLPPMPRPFAAQGARSHTEVNTLPSPRAVSQEEPRQTLHNISFEIKPGQLAALVGPSGAGKTTITYLVPRLYDVDSGAVEIDGHNIKDITLASLGNMIGHAGDLPVPCFGTRESAVRTRGRDRGRDDRGGKGRCDS